MAFLFGARGAALSPSYTGLQLQTSVSAMPISIAYGRTRLAPNVIFYSNFRSQKQTSGGGGKGGFFGSPTVTGYTYSADLIMALCEGPISGIGYVLRDQSTFTLANLGLTLFDGTTPQSVWGYLATTYPNQALAYQGTAYVAAANYQLGQQADIGNHNFEVIGILAGTGVNGIDADPAQVIYDFLTNAQYGCGFDSAAIDLTTLYGSGGDASVQTYCKAMGIAFSPLLTTQEQGSSIFTRWLQLINCGAVWSGNILKIIPYGDEAVASGNVVRTYLSPIPIPAIASSGPTPPPSISVCEAANFVSDGGVINAFTAVALSYIGTHAPTAAGTYGISPAGTYLFHSVDEGKPVQITFTYNVPTGFVPNVAPIYNLTDLDFVDDKSGKDPTGVQRPDPFTLPTIQRIECLSRANQYGATPVEARDQSQIDLYGPRVGSTIQAHEICDEVVIGPIVAQTILQRGLYVRAKFVWKAGWELCLLDPMDVVTLTDATLGLNEFPVRIISIEEDDKGALTITAEELVIGVSTPAANPSSGSTAFLPNPSAAAAPVNSPPLIYEPPPSMTNNVAQVWVGASGGDGFVADPNWGGAYVWASVDNVTYSQLGVITQPLRQGLLTSIMTTAPVGWDTTSICAVNLAESAGALSGTSMASAEAGTTLCLVDNELFAYENATLTAPYQYTLTDLERGYGGTTPAMHGIGAFFYRLDSAVVKYDLPQQYIGVPLYLKFQSYNVFGSGVEDLSTCAVYTYTPSGEGSIGPATQAMAVGTNLDFGLVSQSVSETDDWGPGVAAAPTLTVDLGNV